MATNSPPEESMALDRQLSPRDALAQESTSQEITMINSSQPSTDPKYGGFTQFEMELEFVQSLGSPLYLNHLASLKYLESPSFIAYLAHLHTVFTDPKYIKFLLYPGPTLRNLELLQQERFRKDILGVELMEAMVEEGRREGLRWAEGKF